MPADLVEGGVLSGRFTFDPIGIQNELTRVEQLGAPLAKVGGIQWRRRGDEKRDQSLPLRKMR